MLKRLIVMVVILLLLSFAGCGKKEDGNKYNIFIGENELWSAKYELTGSENYTEKENGNLSDDSWTDRKLTVEYKGELSDLSKVNSLEISYTSKLGGGKLTGNYEGEGPSTKIFTLESGGNVYYEPDKDDVIQVEINIDGEIQNLELKLVE
jgi:hypothetical protein